MPRKHSVNATPGKRVLTTRDLAVVSRGKTGRSPLQDAPHAVYYITDRNMRLLYVGQTSRLIDRLREHAKAKDWFTLDCHIFAEWFVDPEQAAAREAHAVKHGNPSCNQRTPTTDLPDPTPDRPLRQVRDMNRDLGSACSNCGTPNVSVAGMCSACYSYSRTHGCDRPEELHSR